MHTFKGQDGVIFKYNSDLSGDVIVMVESGKVVNILGSDLVRFVAQCYVAPKKIAQLEQATADEILGTT